MSDTEEEKGRGKGEGFKVVDRRHKDADGAGDAAPAPPAAAPAAVAEAHGHDEDDPGGCSCTEFPEKMDFVTFVLSISQTALITMGCGPHPEKGEVCCDLQSAKSVIDILEMLQEKTRGNLTGEEERIFERILTELRLMWVEKRRELDAKKK
jgi:hypothetical protein